MALLPWKSGSPSSQLTFALLNQAVISDLQLTTANYKPQVSTNTSEQQVTTSEQQLTMADETSGSRTVFPCNTCSLSFANSGLQRSHMRGAWHIHNLQRKVSGLPALSELDFAEREDECAKDTREKSRWNDSQSASSTAQRRIDGVHQETSETADSDADSDDYSSTSSAFQNDDDHDSEPALSTAKCLFCPLSFPQTQENLTHMCTAHSFFIPSAPVNLSIEPLLSYLAQLVFSHHECICCGRTKANVYSVQSHMRDTGHCRLDGKDYAEFLCEDRCEVEEDEEEEEMVEDGEAGDKVRMLGLTEMRLPSGVVVNSRLHNSIHDGEMRRNRPRTAHIRLKTSSQQQQQPRAVATATSPCTATPTPSAAQTQALALSPLAHSISFPEPPTTSLVPNTRKQDLSLSGLSAEQLRSLVTLDKKMRRQEVSARNKFRDAAMRQPVKTIYYKTENPVYQAG
ncbi:hypothetical protein ACJQWK_09069 [Exserohilum turcicum]